VYDPTDPADYMALVMLMIISSDELAATKERFREGRNCSSKNDEHIAKNPPYGYDKVIVDKKHTLASNAKAVLETGAVINTADKTNLSILSCMPAIQTLSSKGRYFSRGQEYILRFYVAKVLPTKRNRTRFKRHQGQAEINPSY